MIWLTRKFEELHKLWKTQASLHPSVAGACPEIGDIRPTIYKFSCESLSVAGALSPAHAFAWNVVSRNRPLKGSYEEKKNNLIFTIQAVCVYMYCIDKSKL